MSQKITPYIRCVDNAPEIAEFYTSVFPGATTSSHDAIVTEVKIRGTTIALLNGGEYATPNPSISFSLWITDKDQTKEIRDKLSDGGEVMMEFAAYDRSPAYGRCNDKYGVSRQVMYDNREGRQNMVIPSLMFTQAVAGRAQEAMEFYTKLFPNAEIQSTWSYGSMGMEDSDQAHYLAHAEFLLDNQQFIASDSGMNHKFTFSDGVSLLILTDGQEETDYYRNALTSNGGQEVQCGRCKDQFGVSRQVFPKQAKELVSNVSPEEFKKVMEKMMPMKKIIISELM